jgi:hypothetical protein
MTGSRPKVFVGIDEGDRARTPLVHTPTDGSQGLSGREEAFDGASRSEGQACDPRGDGDDDRCPDDT